MLARMDFMSSSLCTDFSCWRDTIVAIAQSSFINAIQAIWPGKLKVSCFGAMSLRPSWAWAAPACHCKPCSWQKRGSSRCLDYPKFHSNSHRWHCWCQANLSCYFCQVSATLSVCKTPAPAREGCVSWFSPPLAFPNRIAYCFGVYEARSKRTPPRHYWTRKRRSGIPLHRPTHCSAPCRVPFSAGAVAPSAAFLWGCRRR